MVQALLMLQNNHSKCNNYYGEEVVLNNVYSGSKWKQLIDWIAHLNL